MSIQSRSMYKFSEERFKKIDPNNSIELHIPKMQIPNMFVSPKKSPFFDYKFNDNNVLNLSGRYDNYFKEEENNNRKSHGINQIMTTFQNQRNQRSLAPRSSLANGIIGYDQQNVKSENPPLHLKNQKIQRKSEKYGDFYRSMSISTPLIDHAKNEIKKEDFSKKLLSNCINYRQCMKELSRSNLMEIEKHQELINTYNTKPYFLEEKEDPPIFYRIDTTPDREYSRENIREKNRNKIVQKYPSAFTPREVIKITSSTSLLIPEHASKFNESQNTKKFIENQIKERQLKNFTNVKDTIIEEANNLNSRMEEEEYKEKDRRLLKKTMENNIVKCNELASQLKIAQKSYYNSFSKKMEDALLRSHQKYNNYINQIQRGKKNREEEIYKANVLLSSRKRYN